MGPGVVILGNQIPSSIDEGRRQSMLDRDFPVGKMEFTIPGEIRVKVLEAIVTYLESKKPHWQKARILHLATQLEESLYRHDQSLVSYGDLGTLKQRVDKHCLLLGTRKFMEKRGLRSLQHNYVSSEVHSSGLGLGLGVSSNGTGKGGESNEALVGNKGSMLPNDEMDEHGKVTMAHTNATEVEKGIVHSVPAPVPEESRRQSTAAMVSGGCRDKVVVAPGCDPQLNEVPLVPKVRSLFDGVLPVELRQRKCLFQRGVTNGQSGAKLKGVTMVLNELEEESGLEGEEEQTRGCRSSSLSSGSSEEFDIDDEVRDHALRLLQCRLLLLLHSSRCTKKEGVCQGFALCKAVQGLLRHMCDCNKRLECTFPHCVSSRIILSHHHLCKEPACGLCGRVKEMQQNGAWAQAQIAHKQRLRESQDLRRRKRRLESPQSRRQVRAKGPAGHEQVIGLDEAGNNLGHVTPGFFLRQMVAVKAGRLGNQRPEAKGIEGSVIVCNSEMGVEDKLNERALFPSIPYAGLEEEDGDEEEEEQCGNDGIGEDGHPRMGDEQVLEREMDTHGQINWEEQLTKVEESLKDTSRKPSFARMMSVQAFLNDHEELTNSSSYGNVSALMNQWLGVDETNFLDSLDHDSMYGAVSF